MHQTLSLAMFGTVNTMIKFLINLHTIDKQETHTSVASMLNHSTLEFF